MRVFPGSMMAYLILFSLVFWCNPLDWDCYNRAVSLGNDSTKRERARAKAILARKRQEGCVIPDLKRIAAAEKRRAAIQKQN